jgi:hypothetical protein
MPIMGGILSRVDKAFMPCYKSRGTVRCAPTPVGNEFLERSCNGITKYEGWVKIQWDKGLIFSGILQNYNSKVKTIVFEMEINKFLVLI